MTKVTKVKEFCLFYFKKDVLPGRGQRQRPEQSEAITLGTLVHFSHFRHLSVHGEMSELAEGARLEIVCAAKSGTEGSNPSLSAKKYLTG